MSTAPVAGRALPEARWRTRDIVVTAVIGVAFGVVFWAWGLAWSPIEAALGPGRFLFYAVWLVPAVLAPLIVRKPGAALFAEMLAAAVSTLIGSQWGPDTLLSGFVQGRPPSSSSPSPSTGSGRSRSSPWPRSPRLPQPGSTTGSSTSPRSTPRQ